SVEREWAAPGEPVGEAVPKPDLVLADPPAKADLLAAAQRREVEQSLRRGHEYRAELGDPADAGAHLAGELLDPLAERARSGRVDAAVSTARDKEVAGAHSA